MVGYIPDQGDVIWVSFDPQVDHEIQKKRPALVLSLKKYNKASGLAIIAPITSKTKNYPPEVAMKTKEVSGFILSDQIKSIDWRHRNIKYISRTANSAVNETLVKLNALFGIEF